MHKRAKFFVCNVLLVKNSVNLGKPTTEHFELAVLSERPLSALPIHIRFQIVAAIFGLLLEILQIGSIFFLGER